MAQERSNLSIQENLRLRTASGSIGLREPRGVGEFKLEGDGQKTAIKQGWLTDRPEEYYHRAIKQSMLIAARRMALFDATDKYGHTRDQSAETKEREILGRLLAGRERIPVSHLKRVTLGTVKKKDEREKELLIKFGQGCGPLSKKTRQFIILNGQMEVYKDDRLKHTYDLMGARVDEQIKGPSSKPGFEGNAERRLKVDFVERKKLGKDSVYLYPSKNKSQKDQDIQIKRWKRAFKIAEMLKSEVDRRALRFCIGRAGSGALVKGWEALFTYAREIKQVRDLAKQMASRLIKSDLARGWSKLKVLYQKWKDDLERRKQQQVWAARFMCQKLVKISGQKAKAADEIRDSVVTKIQQSFRKYREGSILDREYALDQSKMPLTKKGRQGQHMDLALEALTCEEAMHLSLKGPLLKFFKENRSSFESLKSTYSAAPTPPGSAVSSFLFLSDNLSTLSFTVSTAGPAKGKEHLTKADWANFVNLDRISSVVLHSSPLPGSKLPVEDGVWLTINGPRVSFGKRLEKVGSEYNVLGSADSFAMLNDLTGNKPVRWVVFSVGITDANVASTGGGMNNQQGQNVNDAEDEMYVFAVVHFLGYSFKTEAQQGRVDSASDFKARVPLPQAHPGAGEDSGAFAALDACRIGVEIYECKNPENTISISNLRYVGSMRAVDAISAKSFAEVLPAGTDGNLRVPLAAPSVVISPGSEAKAKNFMSLQLQVSCENKRADEAMKKCCVSPEVIGAGQHTSIFTSHRGAWFDPRLGLSKFDLGHVGSYAELILSGLRFPPTDHADKGVYKYRVRAKTSGFSTHSPYLFRPRDGWDRVLGTAAVDISILKFEGARLCLPLPPGVFGTDEDPQTGTNQVDSTSDDKAKEKKPLEPAITIEILRVKVEEMKTVSAQEFVRQQQTSGRPSKEAQERIVYKSVLRFDKMAVDTVKKDVSAFLTDMKDVRNPEAPDLKVGEIYVNANSVMANEEKVTDGVLNLDFALRDWDYVRSVGMVGEESTHEQTLLCVGERAMLCCEEPMISPKAADPKRFIKSTWKDLNCPLREPCLSSEYADSGLQELGDDKFNQSIIPNYCDDIIPHKYVMPMTEQEFRARRLPGVYWRVMDSLVKKLDDAGGALREMGGMVSARHRVVDTLTHSVKQIPVTILAVYPDETCDLEVDKDFVIDWHTNEAKGSIRKFAIPGILIGHTTKDDEKRYVLQQVPLGAVLPVHSAGFNVYDSMCQSTEDVLKLNIPGQVNSFRPTMGRRNDANPVFTVPAGPVPPDASEAACQYEWRLQVLCKTEYEMYQFVAMLRQATRISHFQNAVKMMEYHRRGEEVDTLALARQHKPRFSGTLEVVLVEARRLKPNRHFTEDLAKRLTDAVWHQTLDLDTLNGTTAGEPSRSTPKGNNISTFVEIRLIDEAAKRVIPVRGQNADRSPIYPGTDSPAWFIKDVVDEKGNVLHRAVEEAGGYVFKVSLNPDKYEHLTLEFAVKQSVQAGNPLLLGRIFIDVQSDKGQHLTNPSMPFKNIWCPLYKDGGEDGVRFPNPTGELQIMTRWLPPGPLEEDSPGQPLGTTQVRGTFLKEIWARITAARAREPTTGIEAQYLVYNPNLVRSRQPETPAYHKQRNVEEMINAARLQMCIDVRQKEYLDHFEAMCAQENLRGLGHIRLKSLEDSQNETNGDGAASKRLQKLQELIEHGVQSQKRQRIWLELTLANHIQEEEPLGDSARMPGGDTTKMAEKEYEALLQKGAPKISDEMLQLQEDCYNMAAAWETGNPVPSEIMSLHLNRIKKAANICTALMAIPPSAEGSIVYCESLLVVAYYLVLPQNPDDRVPYWEREPGMTESSAFWLLYTLIRPSKVNGAFKEYYGTDEVQTQTGELCSISGAMEDIHQLDMCLAYHKVTLWNFLNAIGFQLATVFYGAFMRLFATYLPTLTLYRFWDVLFAHTTSKAKNPRDPLISLAFGVLMVKEKDIMQCKSANEVRDLVLGALGSIHDQATAVDIIVTANSALWGQTKTINPVKMSGMHAHQVVDYAGKRRAIFAAVNEKIKDQNKVLKKLMHKRQLGRLPEKDKEPQDNSPGVTTKKLTRAVLPALQYAVDRSFAQGDKSYWAMHRPMPLALRHFEEDTMLAPLKTMYKTMFGKVEGINVPFMVGPWLLPGDRNKFPLEPKVDQHKFVSIVQQQIPNWREDAFDLWRSFANWHEGEFPGAGQSQGQGENQEGGTRNEPVPDGPIGQLRTLFNPRPRPEEEHLPWHELVMANAKRMAHTQAKAKMPSEDKCLSIHELFTAFILSSRGTVGEKANNLFSIYGYMERKHNAQNSEVYHVGEVTSLARTLVNAANVSEGDLQRSPHPEPVKDERGNFHPAPEATRNALKFAVMTDHPQRETEIGQVLIPSLDPFIVYSQEMLEQTVTKTFIVWGKPLHSKQKDRDRERTVVLAEMDLAIAWCPSGASSLHEGQLCVQLSSIRFVEDFVSDYYRHNPYVRVFTQFQGRGNPDTTIERWDRDNQGIIARLWPGVKHMEFHSPLHKGIGGHLSAPARNGKGMGYDSNTHAWTWNEFYGRQYSRPGVSLDKELFTGTPPRKTTIDLQGVRILVSAILRRSMLNLTNRQQILIADALFNRQRVVPGILEACLGNGNKDSLNFPTKDKKDVTAQIVLEHEKEVANNGGYLTLFRQEYIVNLNGDGKNDRLDLTEMGISRGSYSLLWIKYIRGGDGCRCVKAVDISRGYIPAEGSEVELELCDEWPQTKITKEEFVSCVLNSPLLSEPLRRLGEMADVQTPPSRSIMLEVTLMDPPTNRDQDRARASEDVLGEDRYFAMSNQEDIHKDIEEKEKKKQRERSGFMGMMQGASEAFSKAYHRKEEEEKKKQLEREEQLFTDRALNRFGEAGLKMKFGPEMLPDPGASHGIEVFMGDTISTFKDKLAEACRLEAEKLQNDGKLEEAARYEDIAVTHRHLVMTFVPSAQVQRLFNQRMHETAEYAEAYQKAIDEPSNWQPLDPTMTFQQYASQYGFGRSQGPATQLRVMEGTETYKLMNLRFRKFAEDQNRASYKDTNTRSECFGYVKVEHEISTSDVKEEEWRPAMIRKGDAGGEGGASSSYSVKFLLPKRSHDKNSTEFTKSNVPQKNVILAPRAPLIEEVVDSKAT